MRFPGLNVLDFRFASVQLNRLDWKAFLDKPKAPLRLDPARSALISRFVDSYLDLRAKEVRIWQRQGRLEGRLEGLRSGLASGLRAFFGERALALIERIQSYDLEELQKLERRFVPGARLEDLEAS